MCKLYHDDFFFLHGAWIKCTLQIVLPSKNLHNFNIDILFKNRLQARVNIEREKGRKKDRESMSGSYSTQIS